MIAINVEGVMMINEAMQTVWAVDHIPLLRYVPSWFPGAQFKRHGALSYRRPAQRVWSFIRSTGCCGKSIPCRCRYNLHSAYTVSSHHVPLSGGRGKNYKQKLTLSLAVSAFQPSNTGGSYHIQMRFGRRRYALRLRYRLPFLAVAPRTK